MKSFAREVVRFLGLRNKYTLHMGREDFGTNGCSEEKFYSPRSIVIQCSTRSLSQRTLLAYVQPAGSIQKILEYCEVAEEERRVTFHSSFRDSALFVA